MQPPPTPIASASHDTRSKPLSHSTGIQITAIGITWDRPPDCRAILLKKSEVSENEKIQPCLLVIILGRYFYKSSGRSLMYCRVRDIRTSLPVIKGFVLMP
jgi:hypothetical protein